MATAERLLDERPFADISVDDLAKGAGLSRPTFYFYFPSKDAVLLTLCRAGDRGGRLGARSDARSISPTDRHDTWRTAIDVFFETFGAHRGVTVAGCRGHQSRAPRRSLRRSCSKWIDYTAATIEAERARGAAPTTLPAQDFATALNLMNERALLASFAGRAARRAHRPACSTRWSHIWITSIYGTTP